MDVICQLHVPADLPPGKDPIGKEAGWAPDGSPSECPKETLYQINLPLN
jgi:hypothetical protein